MCFKLTPWRIDNFFLDRERLPERLSAGKRVQFKLTVAAVEHQLTRFRSTSTHFAEADFFSLQNSQYCQYSGPQCPQAGM